MFFNHVRVALRNLKLQPTYAAINILGLAIGLACCLLIVSFIRRESSFDRFHENADRIYRVNTGFTGRGVSSFTDGVIGQSLVDEMPEVEAAARFTRSEHLFSNDETSRYGYRVLFTDPSIFDIFSFRLLRGDPATALAEPNTVVLTESMAEFWFGKEDPLGRIIRMDNEKDMRVTGILENVPANSHIRFEALSSIETIKADFPWYDVRGSISLQTYVLLKENATVESLRGRMPEYAKANYDGGDNTAWLTPRFFPLKDIHLRSATYEVDPQGSMQSIYLFATIGGFILLLACINYMNLSTARAGRRMKEIGIRKASGAGPWQLVFQFLGESVLITTIALGLGIAISWWAYPLVSSLTSVELDSVFSGVSPGVVGLFLLGGLMVGILAGSYPAFYLTRFKAADVLKGKLEVGRKGSALRKGLVVVQFTVSIALLAATFVVQRQLDYMRSKDLGFDRENVVNIPVREPAMLDRVATLRESLAQKASIVDATISTTAVSEFSSSAPVGRADADEGPDMDPTVGFIFTDTHFLDTFDIDLVAGRAFRPGETDSGNFVLVTEETTRRLGWVTPSDALDQQIVSSGLGTDPYTIIGVVSDFHVRSLSSGLVPMMLFDSVISRENVLSIRMAPGDQAGTLASVQDAWNQVLPEWPFEYQYLETELENRSATARQTGRLFGIFSGLAILVGCLGLFGLAAYMAERRTKEIGIRKVLGASAPHLVLLLTKEFAILVGISLVIAIPVIYKGMDTWLSSFAYRIDMPMDVFLWAGLTAIVVALGTVGGQALRAANLDPVRTLRSE